MKKLFSFVAMALLSATTFATQYCQDLLKATNGNQTITLTCEKISDGNYVMTIEGENLQGFGGTFYNPGNVDLRTKITSKTTTKIVCNIDAASDPVFYTPLYVLMPGEVAFPSNDIEWGSCGGEKETIKPVMGAASLASVSYNSAVVTVVGTDKEAEDGEDVAVTRFKVVYGETTKTYTATDGKITITGLTVGTTYSFRIYAVDKAGNVSDNNVIVPDVKTLSYPAAPAAPVHAQDKVFSIYSDAYNSTVTRVTGSWGQQTKEQEVALAEGDNAFFYTNCNYLGWELNGSTTIGDMSLFPNLHMDIYVPEAGSIKFTPIWGAEAAKEYSLVQGWNALDIDLAADFANINLKNIIQLKWDAMPAVCFIDNVYFWKNGTSTQLDAAAVATNVSKMIENGQVVIIREGVKYDVTGRAIER